MTNQEFASRCLGPNDWPSFVEVARLDAELFSSQAFGPQPMALMGHAGWVYAQFDQERAVAYAVVLPTRVKGRAFVMSVGVATSERGRGRATALMRQIIRDLTGEGVSELVLTVDPANQAAVSLYRDKLQFTLSAELFEHFGRGEDRLLLVRRLGRP